MVCAAFILENWPAKDYCREYRNHHGSNKQQAASDKQEKLGRLVACLLVAVSMSPIANMLAQIKNAQARRKEEVALPSSEILFSIAQILKDKGFVEGVEKKTRKAGRAELKSLNLRLKYIDGAGAISGIKLVSKPSRRIYAGKDDLRPVREGFGISIVSTSRGLMAGDDARRAGIGGEIICEVW